MQVAKEKLNLRKTNDAKEFVLKDLSEDESLFTAFTIIVKAMYELNDVAN